MAVIIFDKKTGEIIATEDNRITSVFDSDEWRADMEKEDRGFVGLPYELGIEAINYRVSVDDKGEFQAIIPKNNEEGDA
ncbi:hypothetical protein [Terribacillus saccharophilus]|uniref:hypothetical protein n=1 Tax=Terribacillus saccharophilus TaxID=361277 RepID=UPI000BA7039A|nr:hypothetical protein [Terribacillus saccharophilus]PAF19760.1 hypothetical protein CHH51_01475 [Terribacillus saccharophilus]